MLLSVTQGVAAGSLVNLSTILHLNSVRVSLLHSSFSKSLSTKFFNNVSIINADASNHWILSLCVLWYTNPAWPSQGEEAGPAGKTDNWHCLSSSSS
jgi:hypothetical protein